MTRPPDNPILDVAMKALAPDSDEGVVLHPKGKERLEEVLEELAGSPGLEPAVHELVMFCIFLRDKKGAASAAQSVIDVINNLGPILERKGLESERVARTMESVRNTAANFLGGGSATENVGKAAPAGAVKPWQVR